MITAFHKPHTLDEALALLKREVDSRPLAGGTVLNAPHAADFEAIDLSELGLDAIESKGSTLTVGATATLQELHDTPELPATLQQAILLEATRNLRQVASVAGSLVSADGRSPFAAALLALDANLTVHPGPETVGIGDFLPLRGANLKGKLISDVSFSTAPQLAFEYVARSPADVPQLTVALARWDSGRTRLVIGGFGKAPQLAMDGREPSGLAEAAENVLLSATDQWATAEYRTAAAKAIVERLISYG